jgi:hypothetical protein
VAVLYGNWRRRKQPKSAGASRRRCEGIRSEKHIHGRKVVEKKYVIRWSSASASGGWGGGRTGRPWCAQRGGRDGGAHSATREHEEGVDLVIDFPDAPPPIAINICPASD